MIRIFRHIECEGPGFLAELLRQRQIDFELIAIDEGQPVPCSLDGVSGLVFLGGPMSVNDSLPWLEDELALIKKARAADIPMLGFCLGSQLISKALGGEVFRGDAGQEIGWHAVQRVNSSTAEKWLGNDNEEISAFHWHGETFSLPQGAELILSSKAYPNQAYVMGKTLALQCHIEVSVEMVKEWASLYTADLAQGGPWNQAASEIVINLENKVGLLQKMAQPLLEIWLQGLKEGKTE
ncbi:MAG: type 1 glutamine amidotransferase [Sulfuriflexus sp.]|nr:type 1 glutamine amidotransferase [Sulfuriflexus sp.]